MAKVAERELTVFEQSERETLIHQIHLLNGNLTKIAERAGWSRPHVLHKVLRYGLYSLVQKMRKAA